MTLPIAPRQRRGCPRQRASLEPSRLVGGRQPRRGNAGWEAVRHPFPPDSRPPAVWRPGPASDNAAALCARRGCARRPAAARRWWQPRRQERRVRRVGRSLCCCCSLLCQRPRRWRRGRAMLRGHERVGNGQRVGVRWTRRPPPPSLCPQVRCQLNTVRRVYARRNRGRPPRCHVTGSTRTTGCPSQRRGRSQRRRRPPPSCGAPCQPSVARGKKKQQRRQRERK